MRSRRDDVDPGRTVERALVGGVCGIGGRLTRAPRSLQEALAMVEEEHDERTARRLERFSAVPVAAFVWTRDADGLYVVGRLTGGWRYDGSPGAVSVDLVHVRDCTWAGSPTQEAEVPPAVVHAFGRGGRNFQRIHDGAVSAETLALWGAATR